MADEWFYARKGERFGPVPWAKVRALAEQGWLMPGDLVWTAEMPTWQPAGSVKGLFGNSLVESLGAAVDGLIPGIRRQPTAADEPTAVGSGNQIPADTDALSSLKPRHLLASGGVFVAALGIAFTAIAPSSLGLAFTLGGLALAAAGMYAEIGVVVAQASANVAVALREAAERRLELRRLAVEHKRLEVEAARLAAERESREQPAASLPPEPPSEAPAEPAIPPEIARSGPRLVPAEHYGAGEQVTVITHPPVQRWSPALAAVLSFLLPGLGQAYKGQIISGIVWFFLVGFGYLALILPGLLLHFFCIMAAASGNPWSPGRTEVVRVSGPR